MQTVRVLEKAGIDGVLHLRIPVGQPEAEFEAVIVLQAKSQEAVSSAERGWPVGYFEKTFGSIDDVKFVRQPQGTLPPAVELVTHNTAEFNRVPRLAIEDWEIP